MRKIKKESNTQQPLIDGNVVLECGLNQEQLADRLSKGYVNNVKIGTSKSYMSIIFGNVFTFFNLLCFAIFIWLITVIDGLGGIKNLTFMVIISANVAIGVVQEIKAKKTIDKLSLLSAPDVLVLRCSVEKHIKVNEILLNDICLLEAGNQICSDCVIKSGEVEVNESLLTGESQPIKKTVGDVLLSGSFIVTGKCRAEVIHVGAQNYIQKLALDAKKFKKQESELLVSLRKIMRIIGFIIFPIAILSFLTNWNVALNGIEFQNDKMFGALANLGNFSGSQLYQAYRIAVTPTSTALIGMIPTGLFLLASMALYVGVMRLGKKNALVHELYSIETLARVDMLCLDKTGTITDGTMSVSSVLELNDNKKTADIISSMQYALDGNNQTSTALTDYFGNKEVLEAVKTIPFSSERKCSVVQFKTNEVYLLGAPEFVCSNLQESVKQKIDEQSAMGYRCLILAQAEILDELKEVPSTAHPIAIITIADNIKSDAIETIKYFKENLVDARVISGDNPITVSEVARRVGIENAEKYLNLHGMSDEEIKEVAYDYTVFGRVSPTQKKLLVQIFKSKGHTVAMTGDGINDILALKEADCSIAMANGSEATRNVAQLVLMDSNFGSMPQVVAEGRRVINNIERASVLFLTKTLFSMVLQLILVFMGVALPLEPIQLSFISFFAIGIPSFFLALEPNNRKIEGKFVVNVAKKVLPGSIAIVINVVLIMVFTVVTNIVAIEARMLNTMVMVAIYTVFMQILYNICKPFNTNRFLLYVVLLVWSILCIILMPYGGDSIWNLFNVVRISDITALFMIFTLMLLSENVIRLCNHIIKRFSINGKQLVFDTKIDKNNLFNHHLE